MKKIGIVVDNTCNFSRDHVEKLGVGFIPLYVVKNDDYTKADEVDVFKFYDTIDDEPYIPKTSQPSAIDFEVVYKKMLEEYDEIISIHISEKLSGTCNSARLAASNLSPDSIHVVDTKVTSSALGFLLLELLEKIKNNTDIKVLLNYAENFYKSINIYMTVGDLNYLHKGGRLGKAQAIMGSLLKVNPILSLKEGEIIPIKKVRGKQKLIEEIVSLGLETEGSIKHMAILHTNNKELAKDLKREFEKRNVDTSNAYIDYMDIIIGTHLGPDSAGIIVFSE